MEATTTLIVVSAWTVLNAATFILALHGTWNAAVDLAVVDRYERHNPVIVLLARRALRIGATHALLSLLFLSVGVVTLLADLDTDVRLWTVRASFFGVAIWLLVDTLLERRFRREIGEVSDGQ